MEDALITTTPELPFVPGVNVTFDVFVQSEPAELFFATTVPSETAETPPIVTDGVTLDPPRLNHKRISVILVLPLYVPLEPHALEDVNDIEPFALDVPNCTPA